MARTRRRRNRLKKTAMAVADGLQQRLGPCLSIERMEAGFVDELTRRHVRITRRSDTLLTFGGRPVEKVLADVLLEDRFMVEFKRLPSVTDADLYRFAQFLKVSEIPEGLIINLSPAGHECCYLSVEDN